MELDALEHRVLPLHFRFAEIVVRERRRIRTFTHFLREFCGSPGHFLALSDLEPREGAPRAIRARERFHNENKTAEPDKGF